jgi:hypothetical protein
VKLNIPAPKAGTLQMGSKTQNGYFLENSSDSSDYIAVTYGYHLPK